MYYTKFILYSWLRGNGSVVDLRARVIDTREKKQITEIEYIDFLDAPRSLLAPGFQMWPRHP